MADPTPNDRKALAALLAKTDDVFRAAFDKYVADVQSKPVMDEIMAALAKGDTSAALDIIRAHIRTLGAANAQAFTAAATAAAAEVTQQITSFSPAFSFGFDLGNPRAAEIMRRETQGFITDFTDKQIAATRDALAGGLQRGIGPEAMAREISHSIGLTDYQMKAVENYRRMLERASREALSRALRDRRFDRSVEAAIANNRPIPPKTIDRMVERYRERFVRHRAATIARTESTRATSMAREETFRQLAADRAIGHNRLVRVWNATEDERTRHWHWSMHGQERMIGQQFIDGLGNALMFPGDPNAPAETVINCRCVLTMRILGEDAAA